MNLQCLFGHSRDWQYSRNAEGQMIKRCERCLGEIAVVLAGTVDAGRISSVVAGQPKGKAQRVVKDNVAKFR